MTPYFDDGQITIYHADCREILPTLAPGSIDLVVADPPYPGLKGGTKYAFDGVAKRSAGTVTVGTPWDTALDWIEPAWALSRLGMMIFCSHHSISEVAAAMPPSSRVALVTWYKRNAPPAIANVPRFTSEFIWLFKKAPGLKWRNITSTVIDVPNLQSGCMASERIQDNDGTTSHPTQKPIALLHHLLAVGGTTVLDPFMGTGTTLRAAKNLGQRVVGIEREERYCEIAVKSLSQSVLPFDLAS